MNIPNIYQGLEVEPPMPIMIEQIHLTARIVDPIHFVLIPERWEQELKPYKKAQWKHEKGFFDTGFTPCNYEIKSGVFLVFPQFKMTQGGFYAAHLYMIVKEMERGQQAQATLTVEGLTIEQNVDGLKHRTTLKPRGLSKSSTAYHAVLGY